MKPFLVLGVVLCFFASTGASQLVYQPNASPAGTHLSWWGCVVAEQIAWFAYDPDGAAASSRYISRSTDGGNTWHYDTIHVAPTTHTVGIMSAVDASTAWAVTVDNSGATSGALFKTTDGGDTWTHQTSAFPGSGGFLNNVHFFDPDNGVCTGDQNGGYFEIYTTTDGGENWVRVPSERIPAGIMGYGAWNYSYAYHGDCFWFADTRNRVYRTTDKG